MKLWTFMVFLIIVIVLLINFIQFDRKVINQTEAIDFVIEDLTLKYPNYEYSILFVNEKINFDIGNSYFHIKASIRKDDYVACPERINIYYNYPEQNFITEPEEYVTKNCKICDNCILLFEEEAIIASHTRDNTQKVRNYLLQYDDAFVYVEKINSNFYVLWDSKTSENKLEVIMDNRGNIIEIIEIEK